MRVRRREDGDTIVEVLFAITVFSLIAIGSLSLMNQGTAVAQRALEVGQVRQQIDSQADALRYMNRAYVADYGKNGAPTTRWNKIVAEHTVEKAQDFDDITEGMRCRQLPSTVFALDVTALDAGPIPVMNISDYNSQVDGEPPTYAQVRHGAVAKAQGLWIEAVRPREQSPTQPGYYDFHIRACWISPGQVAPVTIGTIVRLYDPAPSR